jgi:prepilin-type N-terminal cleavage/methylation domain-containing protein/prepilin-type processing-associated H-X9-DG protein
MDSRASHRHAFTLIELLVVIAIIGILIALLLPAVQKVRESANRARCQNNLKQLGLACQTYHDSFHSFPPGNRNAGGDKGSWLFMVLPYIEQGNLYKQVITLRDGSGRTYDQPGWTMHVAVTAGILPHKLPFSRCPSDSFDLDNGKYCNYVGSSGPQCNYGNCGYDIFQRYCNGQDAPDVPPPLNTYPGYGPSMSWGDTTNAALVRGMFARGRGGDGPAIRIADVSDGTTNTILIGETLPKECEFQRFGYDYGWAGYNTVSQGQTIQTINYPILDTDRTTFTSDCSIGCPNGDPRNCIMNWHITWGFKSKHTNGVNFVFVDGSVHFVHQNIDHQTYQYLGCRHDGQSVNFP